MRLAAIDIGTNTVLLLIAERAETGELRAIEEQAEITRLGEGVDQTRSLSMPAVERTKSCLERYSQLIRAAGADRVEVVGTSAMRDAAGGGAFRTYAARLFGKEPRVLTGDEEARLSFLGALSGLPRRRRDGRQALRREATQDEASEGRLEGSAAGLESSVGVFDIGGGSTEVVIGRPGSEAPSLSYVQSFELGSVRLTERFAPSEPPTVQQLNAIRTAARDAFRNVPALPEPLAPVGVAGTMTTLAAVSLELSPYDGARVHGVVLRAGALAAMVERLASIPLQARARLPGMEPKRADVIVAGGIIAVALLEHWRANEVIVSDRGVRWGIAEELLRQGATP